MEHQTPALTMCDATATLQFQNGTQALTFDLSEDPLPEARQQLQDLMFGLVEQLQALRKSSKGLLHTLSVVGSNGLRQAPPQYDPFQHTAGQKSPL